MRFEAASSKLSREHWVSNYDLASRCRCPSLIAFVVAMHMWARHI